MTNVRVNYSISDLFEMDAKGNQTILPYLCLVEAEGIDEFLKSERLKIYSNEDRTACFLDWINENRKLCYSIYKPLSFIFTKRGDNNLLLMARCFFNALMYYYMINKEHSFNRRIKFRMESEGMINVLRAKQGGSKKICKSIFKSLPEEFVEEQTENLLHSLEFHAGAVLKEDDLDKSFCEIEMLMSDILRAEQIMVLRSQHDEELAELEEQLRNKSLELKKKDEELEILKNKLTKIETQRAESVGLSNTYQTMNEQLEEEVLSLQQKLTKAEDRIRLLTLTVTKEEEQINNELLETENSLVDLDKYNIILCGREQYLNKYPYKILDYYQTPQRIGALDSADVVAIITTDISHSAYWAIKTYCRKHGLNYCNINGNTTTIVETGLKNYIRENNL